MQVHRWLSSLVAIGIVSATACKSGERPEAGDQPQPAAEREPPAEQPLDAIERAHAMTKSFAGELQATLLAAIEAGGPAHAISVCKHDAPKIAAAAADDGWTLSRTALRVRNPDNAPTSWQRTVLDSWVAQIDEGKIEDPASLEWVETIEGASGLELRYMRAIKLGGVCLACHGPVEQISDEVQSALAEQYPEDQATGFRVGELRGAFVVTGPL